MGLPSTKVTFNYSDKIQINYEVRGSGQTTLLLLHGFGASLESWRDIQPILEAKYRLVLVDMKGFGNSSKPADRAYSIFDQAAIINALYKSLNLSDFVLVGHSYGGSVALATYLTNVTSSESSIRSLVLIDAPCYPQSLPFFIKALRTPVLNRISLNLTSPRTRASYILHHIFFNRQKVTSERIERYAKYFDLPGSHDAMIASAKQLIPEDPASLSARIGEIVVPTLILWGANDPLIFNWQGERLHAGIRRSKLVVFKPCGHVPQEERPQDTAREIIQFIG